MESTERKTADTNEAPTKKKYQTPKLIDYGTVAQVTQAGATVPGADGATLSS